MSNKWNRRDFLKLSGSAAAGAYIAAAGGRSAKADGGTITVGVEAGSPYEKFYGERAAQFTKATGVNVKLNSLPHDSMRQQFAQDAIAGAGGFDVYTADQVWLPEFAEKGFIVDLTSKLDAKDKADFAGTALDTVTWGGKLFALPIIIHNCAMYYRTDLFEAAGLSAAPATWDEYRAFAKKLTNKSTGVWGTLIAGKRNIEAATRFHSFLQQAGGDLLDASNKPTLDSDAGHKALEFMTEVEFTDQSAPPGVNELSDAQGLWLDGKLAMLPVWPYLYSLGKDPKQSKVVGKYKVDLPPGNPNRVATAYMWGFCASTGSKNQDAAWEWVKWSTSTDVLADFGKTWINPVPRKSAIAKVQADPTLSADDKAAIATFAKSAAVSKTMNMVPQYSELLDVVGIVISNVMSKAMSIDAALKDGQKRAEDVMKA